MKTPILRKMIALFLALSVLTTTVSACSKQEIALATGVVTGIPSSENSMVQIWSENTTGETDKEGTPLAYGLVVGDGSLVLTVFDYEDEIPAQLYAGIPGQPKYTAIIRSIDPVTSATLLQLENSRFPPAYPIAGENTLTPGTQVKITGWETTDYRNLIASKTIYPGPGLSLKLGQETFNAYPGAIVSDANSTIYSMIGVFYNAFVIRLGPIGGTGPIFDVASVVKTLMAGDKNQSWEKTPVYALITTKESLLGETPSSPLKENWYEMSAALDKLVITMGVPLPADEIPEKYRGLSWGVYDKADGTLLTVVYPRAMELKNGAGQVAATARWIGVQWGRSEGKPNRIFYGHFNGRDAITDGGFCFTGDTGELESSIK